MDSDNVRILNTERLLNGFFQVDQLRLQHKLFDGDWSQEVDRLLLHRPDAVCAVVHNTDRDTLLFVRQFRLGVQAKEHGWLTEVAAGLIDKDETPREACIREVAEELGYSVSQCKLLSSFYTSPAIISERIYLFYCPVVSDDIIHGGGGLDDEHEDILIKEIPVEYIPEFIVQEPLRDAKSILAVLTFQQMVASGGVDNWAANDKLT